MDNPRILLGMSGGTDSSVSAILLKEKGYNVVGITFSFFPNNEDIEKAKYFSKELNIEHYVVNLQEEFREKVINYFIEDYLVGKTPFPCVFCNPQIKWKYLEEYANKLNCSKIATGHYVQKVDINGIEYISKGKDPDKDQSFFLWGLNQIALKKTIFPLGNLFKNEVRKIARDNGFSKLAEKRDSLGICFIQHSDYRPFLKEQFRKKNILIESGYFVDYKGNILGKHKGYPFYTIGQRRGLGLNVNEPLFVLDIRHKENEVVLGAYEELYKTSLEIDKTHFQNPMEIQPGKAFILKIRYRNQATPCNISIKQNNQATIHLLEKLSAIAPGQASVIYDGNRILGGGFIKNSQ